MSHHDDPDQDDDPDQVDADAGGEQAGHHADPPRGGPVHQVIQCEWGTLTQILMLDRIRLMVAQNMNILLREVRGLTLSLRVQRGDHIVPK